MPLVDESILPSREGPRGLALLHVSPEVFVEVCKGFTKTNGMKRSFEIIENPIPADAAVENVEYRDFHFVITLSSLEWSQIGPPFDLPCPVIRTHLS